MLQNFLKIAYRNLFKYRYYSIINILSFAIGLAVFATAFLYATDELSFDSFHKNAKRIYRIANVYEKDKTKNSYATNPFPMARALQMEYPQYIEKTCRIFNLQNNYHLIEYNEKHFSEKNFFYADSSVFDVFDFQFISGNPLTVLKKPNTVIISESMKEKYFGSSNVIGEQIVIDDGLPYIVEGVFRDFPMQSHIHFDIITSSTSLFSLFKEPDTWLWNACWTYILIKENADEKSLEKKFPDFVNKYFDETIREYSSIFLQALTDIHLKSELELEIESNNKSLYIYILLIISFFLLFVSFLNFINLSIVGSITRVREISIRKIMGSSRRLIVWQFLTEALLLSLISFFASLFFTEGLLPVFRVSTGYELQVNRLFENGILQGLLAFSLIAGVVVGIYTGLYASSFPVFNIGRFKLQIASRKWFSGKILIIVQYIISLILLIAVLINFRQLVFLKNTKLGFDKDRLIVLNVTNNPIANEYERFKSALKEDTDIEFVTASNNIISTQREFRKYFYFNNGVLKAEFLPELIVRHDFLRTLGIKIVSGSDFIKGSTEDVTTSSGEVIINEYLVKQLGFKSNEDAIHKKLFRFKGNEQIVGVIKDINTRSLHNPVNPLIIRLSVSNYSASEDTKYVLIKFKSDISKEKIKYISKQWKSIALNWPFEFKTLNQVLDEQYKDEEGLNFFLWVFSILTILIGSMGVWAVSSLISMQKTKEIGIRKAIGALIYDILKLFIKDFTILLIIANLVAWPISGLILKQWFKNFANHIDLQWQYFLISSLLILILTVAIVSKHALKVARSSTVDSLRDE